MSETEDGLSDEVSKMNEARHYATGDEDARIVSRRNVLLAGATLATASAMEWPRRSQRCRRSGLLYPRTRGPIS